MLVLLKLAPKLAAVGLKFLKIALGHKAVLLAGSALAYSFLWSWRFALVLLAAVLVHELGHAWAMKRTGMKVRGIYFIPFLGAAVISESRFPSRWAQTVVCLAGPTAGLLVPLGFAVAHEIIRDDRLLVVSAWTAFVNLFSLLPAVPLDGGWFMQSLAFSLRNPRLAGALLAGAAFALVVGIVYVAFTYHIWFLIELAALLTLVGAVEMLSQLLRRKVVEKARQWAEPLETLSPDEYRQAMESAVAWLKAAAGSLNPVVRLKRRFQLLVLGEKDPDRLLGRWQAIREADLKRLARAKQRRELPPMNRRQMAIGLCWYALTVSVCVWLIALARHIPGARELTEVLG